RPPDPAAATRDDTHLVRQVAHRGKLRLTRDNVRRKSEAGRLSRPPRRQQVTWRQDSMINPPIEELLGRVDSKFSLVTLAARRARQVNSYFNQLGEGLGSLVPPQVASTARKPLSIAFEEIAADKIVAVPLEEAPVEGDEAEPEA